MSNTLPSPPFIEVPGIHNFRDAGGNGLIRGGMVYRSADPTRASEAGLQKMAQELGIKVIFDLRSSTEIKRDGPEWAGVEVDAEDPFAAHGIQRRWIPVFAEEDYGPEQVALRYKNYTRAGTGGFVQAYTDILKSAPPAYGEILRWLAREHVEPCLVHCTAGKDRTGVLIALLFMLVGVDRDKIGEEYSLTDQGLAHLKALFAERLLKNPALEGDREGVQNMISSKKENMEATYDMILEEFGGAEKYMTDYCKLDEKELLQLKKNLAPI